MRHFEEYDGFSSLWRQKQPGYIVKWIVETKGMPQAWWAHRHEASYAMIHRKVLFDAALRHD